MLQPAKIRLGSTIMGKLIIGIVIVFVLQLAFVLYLRSGPDVVELSQLSNMPSSDVVSLTGEVEHPEPSAQVFPNEDIYEIYDAPTATSTLVVKRGDPAPARSAKRSRTVRSFERGPSGSSEPPVLFSDTVIIVERNESVPNYQGDEFVPESVIRKPLVPNFEPTKRSPFTRVRAVVRKPYDWARGFATKIF